MHFKKVLRTCPGIAMYGDKKKNGPKMTSCDPFIMNQSRRIQKSLLKILVVGGVETLGAPIFCLSSEERGVLKFHQASTSPPWILLNGFLQAIAGHYSSLCRQTLYFVVNTNNVELLEYPVWHGQWLWSWWAPSSFERNFYTLPLAWVYNNMQHNTVYLFHVKYPCNHHY